MTVQPAPFDLDAQVVGLQTGFDNLRQEQHRLRNDFSTFQGEMRRDLSSLNASLGQKIDGLAGTFAAKSTPKWGVVASWVGVGCVILTMLGGFAYWPLKQKQDEHDARFAEMVPRVELDREWRRSDQSMLLLRERIKTMEDRTYDEQRREIDRLKAELSKKGG